jgi:diguanylate cyclase (GGDEF)-like protein
MSVRAIRSGIQFAIIVAVGLTCTAALAIGLTIWWLRSDAIHNASREADNLSIVLADQIQNSILSIDLILTEIQSQEKIHGARVPNDFDRIWGGEDTYRLLVESLSHLKQAEFIGIVDKNGRLVNTTQVWPSPNIDLSDRDYLKHFKNNNENRIYVSSLLVSRITGVKTILFTKRISDTNDTFLGMVVVGVRLAYFQQIYESIASLNGESFLFLRSDGTVLARYPDLNDRAGEEMPPESPWHRLALQGGGHYRSPGYFDSEARLVAVRPLRDYPVVINVAVSETAALATWRIQAITISIGTLLVIFCSVFLLRSLSTKFHLLATSEASLIEKTHELERANAKVDAALNNMSQGLVMFDSSARLIVCNHRYIELYGLSPEIVRPGCTLRELLEHRVATGSFSTDDVEQYLADIAAAVGQKAIFSKIANLRDGRIISIVNHPIADGGWVATHEDITEQKRVEERIAHAAYVDALTGLPNRKLFCEQLEQELKRARRGERLAVLYLDLDHLKRVNDTLGHPVGDELLKGVADRLRGCVRDIDLVARLSGDEFAIIQKLLDQPSDAATLAMRAREAILEPFNLLGHQVKVDISIGISIAPNDATELNDLLKTADIALYEAKNTGRGTYCFYEPEMNARMQTRAKLERDLQSALPNGEFELFYQPVVNLENNKISSFEALLRWHHPERGIISPSEFIPVAEEMGLIVPLGEWVLRTACAEAATWPDDIHVAVNVSSIQLTNKYLVNAIIGAIASAGIKPNRLELEITESIFMQNNFASSVTLKSLHELGVQFAMDDFGTGYSSLGYLLSFPFHKIKIDRSFITGLPDKMESRAIVGAITSLARNLSMRVTAEGVETAQQLEQVRILGCTEMQGYLFSPPRPISEIHQLFLPNAKDTVCAVSQVA